MVIIFLVGCQSEKQDYSAMTASGSISQIESIEDYLVTNVGISAFGGKVFCADKPLDGVQGVEGKKYLWALCQEYYLEQGSLKLGSGVSLPVALRIREQDGHYEVIDHLVPRDGAYYGPDVRATFPQSTWAQVIPRRRYNQKLWIDSIKEAAYPWGEHNPKSGCGGRGKDTPCQAYHR